MKKKYLKYCGSLQQVVYCRPVEYVEGRSGYMHAIEVRCGDLFFHVQIDKAMDISDLMWRGKNMTFLAKPGLEGRNPYDTNGDEAQRSIMGGLFFTAGFENICAPCTIDGKDYPMHGRIRTTPAEHVCGDVIDDGDRIRVVITGEMREAELFGENMVLRRKIETVLGEDTIRVTDEIENQSFRKEPLMVLYHCNLGYPFLEENTELYVPSSKVIGREKFSEQHVSSWNRMEEPVDNEQEYVFIHDILSDENGNTAVLAVNPSWKTGLQLKFNTKNLNHFMEWKSRASGDYVMGLEPSNAYVYGREYTASHGALRMLDPFEKVMNVLEFSIEEGERRIAAVVNRIEHLKEKSGLEA